jgi:hemolysin D
MSGKQHDQHEFKPLLVEIEEEPLNPLGRMIFWVIIAALIFFGLWLVLGKTDVVVTARGKVIPAGETKEVQPLTTGVVRKILVQPGDYVEKGQVLMEIDPSDIDPELVSMRKDLAQVRLELLRLDALLNDTGFGPPDQRFDAGLWQIQLNIYHSTRERLANRINVKRQELEQLGKRLEGRKNARRQAVYQHDVAQGRLARMNEVKDLLSKDELEKAENDIRAAATQMQIETCSIEELQTERHRVEQEIALVRKEERQRLLDEVAEKRQRLAYLQGKIERSEFLSSRQRIESPVTGHVAQLLCHTTGGVVTPAEKLATIVPLDSPLLIRALVQNKDVGFLRPAMSVSLKIDTFDFQKYGVLDGELLHISRDSIEDRKQGLIYEIYVKPRQKSLLVEGKQTPISAGMSVTAEVKVGKRRIIEFFIYPLIKYLDEGISVK